MINSLLDFNTKGITIKLLDEVINFRNIKSFIHIANKTGSTELALEIARKEEKPVMYIDTLNSIHSDMNIPKNLYIFNTNRYEDILDFISMLSKHDIKMIIINSIDNIIFPEEEDNFKYTKERYKLFNSYIRILIEKAFLKEICVIGFNRYSEYSEQPYCYSSQLKKIIDHDLKITEYSLNRVKIKNVNTDKEKEIIIEGD